MKIILKVENKLKLLLDHTWKIYIIVINHVINLLKIIKILILILIFMIKLLIRYLFYGKNKIEKIKNKNIYKIIIIIIIIIKYNHNGLINMI